MPVIWKKTKFPGVRYYEHKSRKHGIQKDKYFAIRYQRQGKRKEEGLGWSSDGWTAPKAALELSELKKAYTTGQGAVTLEEKRIEAKKQKEDKKAKEKREAREQLTFGEIFLEQYYPRTKQDKTFKSHQREHGLFENWIEPVIGDLPLKDVAPIHIEKIKKNKKDAELSARSIQYCLAVIRQVFNFAYRNNLYNGDNPVTKVKSPKVDNRRLRFLTLEEAGKLLKALQLANSDVWEQALISLHCGLRASEIFRLKWIDVDISNGLITVKDSKSSKTSNSNKIRTAYMTKQVKDMFLKKISSKPNDLIYTNPDGEALTEISRVFERIVKDLKLNEGVTDRRDKIVFHSLRHTYASWLVEEGTDIYVVQKLLGHSTLSMTERYAHLRADTLRNAVKNLENKASKINIGKLINDRGKIYRRK